MALRHGTTSSYTTISTLRQGTTSSYTSVTTGNHGTTSSYTTVFGSSASWHSVWSGSLDLTNSSQTITSSVSSSATQIRVTYTITLYDFSGSANSSYSSTSTFNKGASSEIETSYTDQYSGTCVFLLTSSGTSVSGQITSYEVGTTYYQVPTITKVEAYY